MPVQKQNTTTEIYIRNLAPGRSCKRHCEDWKRELCFAFRGWLQIASELIPNIWVTNLKPQLNSNTFLLNNNYRVVNCFTPPKTNTLRLEDNKSILKFYLVRKEHGGTLDTASPPHIPPSLSEPISYVLLWLSAAPEQPLFVQLFQASRRNPGRP